MPAKVAPYSPSQAEILLFYLSPPSIAPAFWLAAGRGIPVLGLFSQKQAENSIG
ncbi:hypothetical protein FHS90_003283 [Rufibacter quisquiliarum]|uniref:Uncharacterized protein n=1 Tax=Rufibacter quisquiliarum TaxID=1549639 RepID=A0A839GL67_9BACT|nr:hypothetical protein [Rufibacter quisquiliarum]